MKKYIIIGIIVSSPVLLAGGFFVHRYMGYMRYGSLIKKGERLLSAGQSFPALAAYTEAVKLQPNRPLAYLERSRAHIARSERADAIRDLKKAIDLKPDNPGPYIVLGDLYLQTDDYFKAAGEYERAIGLGVVRAPLYYKYGYAMFRASEFDTAIQGLKKALEESPDMGLASALMGTIYLGRGELEPAETALRNSIGQLPEKDRPYTELGLCLYERGKYQDAMGFFKKALETQGKKTSLYVMSARCLAMTGDREGAIRQLESAIAQDSKQSAGYVELARLWIRAADEQTDAFATEKAVTAIEQALAISPNSSELHFMLGRVYEIRKDYARAMESYNRATRLWPTVPESYEQMAAVSIQQRNRPQAERFLQKAAVLKAKSPGVFSFYGRFLMTDRRYDEAADRFRTAITLNPNNTGYYLSLAEAQRLAGRRTDARETLQRALAVEPNNAEIQAALRRIGA
ncbi:MAG: tetratricopeptide repeat protein [Acidobacteriota bacterium]